MTRRGRLRRRLGGEEGFTLLELLVSSSLMLVILSATLLTFTNLEVRNREANDRAEAQDAVRRESDRLARALRNLAGPTDVDEAAAVTQAAGLDVATPFDLVFRTVDPQGPNAGDNAFNVRRVRWCLDDDAANAKVHEQVQVWTSKLTPPLPSRERCPDPAWPAAGTRVVAEHLTNRATSPERPAFRFNGATPADITHVRTDLFVDPNGAERAPAEAGLRSGVALRNHNARPRADFVAARSAGGQLLLNGSLSTDPEGDPLKFSWEDGGIKLGCEGVVAVCTPNGSGARQITLVVQDAAGLVGSVTKTVADTATTGGVDG